MGLIRWVKGGWLPTEKQASPWSPRVSNVKKGNKHSLSTQQRHHEEGSHGPGQNSAQKQQSLPTSDIFKPTPATSASQQRRGTHYQRPKIITQHNYYNQRKELGRGGSGGPPGGSALGSLTTYRLGLLLQPRFAACLFPAAPGWLFPIKQQCEQSMPFRPLPETKKVKLRRLLSCYGNKESIPETLDVPPGPPRPSFSLGTAHACA